MEDNKKNFDEFFKNEEPKETETAAKQEKPSYYYSYGPYKSSEAEEHKPQQSLTVSDAAEVEMTAPQPLRSMDALEERTEQSSVKPAWVMKEKRKRSVGMVFFAGFLASALVLGSLMFVSDKMNLFTGDKVFVGIGIISHRSSKIPVRLLSKLKH
jgi:serine protease Do